MELLKVGGDVSIKILLIICNNIWRTKEWPRDWKKSMGVPVHLIALMRKLFTKQEATVRTEFGETYTINIGKGVRQGCILSTYYLTYIQKT